VGKYLNLFSFFIRNHIQKKMSWLWSFGSSTEPESEDWITWKTIAFVGVCGVCIWGLASLVNSVGNTAEKIDDVLEDSSTISSDSEESSDEN
jgi:hypothetical protein